MDFGYLLISAHSFRKRNTVAFYSGPFQKDEYILTESNVLQPRSQGFSLLSWVGPIQKGKALGTRLNVLVRILAVADANFTHMSHRASVLYILGRTALIIQKR